MERYTFIHGSSVGQSIYVPVGVPENLCSTLADRYFKGRILRQRESALKCALFVELLTYENDNYCAYTFVNNDCLGANSRDGQYFAITILSKQYILPESVYNMLRSAYYQMHKSGKVLTLNNEGKDIFVIGQFKEQGEYLDAFLQKIDNAFKKVAHITAYDIKGTLANFDTWNGDKVALDICNSTIAFDKFCKVGRLYISEEYETSSSKISSMMKQISELSSEIQRIQQTQQKEKSKKEGLLQEEISQLKQELQGKDSEILKLQNENERYNETISIVQKELSTYSGASREVAEEAKRVAQTSPRGKKNYIRLCILIIILALTTLNALMSYSFFRNIPLIIEEIKAVKETAQSQETENPKTGIDKPQQPIKLNISPTSLTFNSDSDENYVYISGGDWNVNEECDWITATKESANRLTIKVTSNTTSKQRNGTVYIEVGETKETINILQEAKIVVSQPTVCPDYRFTVTDQEDKVVNPGDSLTKGTIIKAVVENPSFQSGIGWKYSKCKGGTGDKNEKMKNITITGEPGATVVFSYGDLNNRDLRKKFVLYVKNSN